MSSLELAYEAITIVPGRIGPVGSVARRKVGAIICDCVTAVGGTLNGGLSLVAGWVAYRTPLGDLEAIQQQVEGHYDAAFNWRCVAAHAAQAMLAKEPKTAAWYATQAIYSACLASCELARETPGNYYPAQARDAFQKALETCARIVNS